MKQPADTPALTESESLECKKSLAELSEGMVSISAILNKHGAGDLWFGISPKGIPVGMDVTEATLRRVSQAIAAHIDPKIYPEVTREELGGKACVHVRFSGNQPPYYAHGRPYIRVADEDRQMAASELESMILAKHQIDRSWDSAPTDDPRFELDEELLRAFVEKAGLRWKDATTALENLDLLRKGAICNAANLFFSKRPRVQLRCALFAGMRTATILDSHDFTGDLLTLIHEAETYILKHIRIGMRLDGLRRVDVPEIDRDAMREAIINAFCHRDYRHPDEVRVAIFTDRVEIRNPGLLMDGLTIENLLSGHRSVRRNPLVADLLRRIQLIEAWGRGISLILEKAPNTRFDQFAGTFTTTFPRTSTTEVTMDVTPQVAPQVTPQVEQVITGLGEELDRSQLQAKTGLKARKNFRNLYLQPAIEQGLVEMTIPDKPTSRMQRYRLTEAGLRLRTQLLQRNSSNGSAQVADQVAEPPPPKSGR
jgi:ATP-dependent DNA helicase RecG